MTTTPITVLDFPVITDLLTTDYLYMIRGAGLTRDSKMLAGEFIPTVLSVVDTVSIDLSTYKNDLIIFANKATPFTITFSNYLRSGKKVWVIGKGAGLVTLAGTITDVVFQNETRNHITDGTAFYNRNVEPMRIDTIQERTTNNGVNIEGVNLKDNGIVATGSGTFNTGIFSGGVQTDSNLFKFKEISIGDWNMDSTTNVDITHGLGSSWKNIRSIDVIIRNDADTEYYSLTETDTITGHNNSGSIIRIDSTIIRLNRTLSSNSGFFDTTDFDQTSYNRGYIFIIYKA